MSSILKILVDIPCEVYCDNELKGEAYPQSIFRIELRKGTYILEFKQNGELLYSQEYNMLSNDEENLLRISLTELLEKKNREERYKEIEKLDVKYWLSDDNIWVLENKNDGSKTHINFRICQGIWFDECGLLNVNVGGVEHREEVGFADNYIIKIEGGKWGCVNKKGEIQIPIIYDSLVYFNNPNVTAALIEGRVVFVNKWNEIVFDNPYDVVEDNSFFPNEKGYAFAGGLCIVKKNGKYGLIDDRGEEKVPLYYDNIDRYATTFGIEVNGKWGLIDYQCLPVTPIMYDSLSHAFHKDKHQFFYVKISNREGMIDETGKTIIPVEHERIRIVSEYHGYFLITKDTKKGVYRYRGDSGECILEPIYDDCEIVLRYSGYIFIVTLNGKMGLFDDCGKQLLNIKYDAIKKLHGWNYFLINNNGCWHLYKVEDKEIICFAFEDYEDGVGYQIIAKSNGLYDVYDYVKDNYLFDIAYDDITKTSEGSFYIITSNGKKGICNDKGVFLYAIQYDYIDIHQEAIIAVLNGRLLIYNYSGSIIFDKGYEIPNIEVCLNNNLGYGEAIIVKRDGKWGCLNNLFWHIEKEKEIAEIKEIIPCKYDNIAYNNRKIVSESNINKENVVSFFVKEGANGEHFYYRFHIEDDEAKMDFVWIEHDRKNKEKLYLFFDTETTGIPNDYNAPSSDTNNWPRLVQLAWILTDGEGNKIHNGNLIVKPDGFVIPADATKIHGITTRRAHYEGRPINEVVKQFKVDLDIATYIVGHNIEFDKKIVGAEMIRLGMKDIMDTKKSYCTMQSSIDFCKIPSTRGYKYPKLQELHKKLFGSVFDDAHNAMSDIEATEKCFWELKKRNIVK